MKFFSVLGHCKALPLFLTCCVVVVALAVNAMAGTVPCSAVLDGTAPTIYLTQYADGSGAVDITGCNWTNAAVLLQYTKRISLRMYNVSIHGGSKGNYIGTDITGSTALPNNIGIGFATRPSQNNIENNVISGNGHIGIILYEECNNNTVYSNKIGVAADGSTALSNKGAGIVIAKASKNNLIGGVGKGNIIAYNDTVGIAIIDTNTLYNTMSENTVFANDMMDVDRSRWPGTWCWRSAKRCCAWRTASFPATNSGRDPLGVAVVVEAEHLCMTMRGIRKPGALTVTSALRGLCKKDARSRAEVMSLIHSRP